VAEQLAAIGVVPEAVLCEPAGRNTAPALAAAAFWLRERDPAAIMLVLPSDHYIGDEGAFAKAVTKAIGPAEGGSLVTFGIRPTRAETGYGYIERGTPLDGADNVYAVTRFVEKPDHETAERLVASGSYLWNSGMFVLSVVAFLEELERHGSAIAAACMAAVVKRRERDDYVFLDHEAFTAAPAISVDYAIMEHTDRAAVVPIDMAWSDIGSWRALRDAKTSDKDGNVLEGDVFVDDVHNSYIRADGRLVAAVGLDNVVIVTTDDAVLVSDATRAGEVGRMTQRLKEKKRSESFHHRRVYRPWGYYQSIETGAGFQVKHLMVKSGARLSLQMHHHRAEHWVVVSGTARVTCGDETRLLSENERTFIPLGTPHRLENPGKIPLHVIEVQVGTYLGEDDIVRFEDNYGRA
jgi:mannose-1-phosphate guanylyltransferase/mannose-6-phosphate isomerase